MREISLSGTDKSVKYHEYACSKCGCTARNTYCEPHRTDMLTRLLCWDCNFWMDQEILISKNHAEMTIISGHIYTPGNATTGPYRGMAGRRFDIEYIPPSIYAGQKCTTFDLWSGSTMPEKLQKKFPDTARFLNNAEFSGRAWNSSDNKDKPYPLPQELSK